MRRLSFLRSRRAIGPLVVVVLAFAFVAVRVIALVRFEGATAIALAVVYDSDENRSSPAILTAYDRALAEEGIPHVLVAQTGQLLLLPGNELARRFPAMILADGINRRAPAAFARRMQEYVAAGGSLAIVCDVASEDRLGHYLGHGRLIDLAGVDYVRYGVLGSKSYVTGAISFRDPATARLWNVPAGKLSGSALSSSTYGRLRYPLPASRIIAPSVEVVASDGAIPVITVRHLGSSTVAFTGLPLGYLEAAGDALPLRFMVRTFTRQLVPLPRLVATPNATGALIADWHVDVAANRTQIAVALRRRYLRPDMRFEFDVVTGRDRVRTGDRVGFDACGSGAASARTLAAYGNVGLLLSPSPEPEPQAACLARTLGRPIESLATPGTPPAAAVEAVNAVGSDAYFDGAEGGVPPSRPFVAGRPAETHAWEFNVMPDGVAASLGEMREANLRPGDVERWLDSTADYAAREGTIQPIYSRFDDLMSGPYGGAWTAFLDRLDGELRDGTIALLDMPGAARFMRRLVATTVDFRRTGGSIDVDARNPGGLDGIAFAIPAGWLAGGSPPMGIRDRGVHQGFHYFSIASDDRRISLRFKAATK